MCLDLMKDDSTLKVAKEDIICYKWLLKYRDGALFSPYQQKQYQLNSRIRDVKRSIREVKRREAYGPDGDRLTHTLTQGGFHTFKNKEDALCLLKYDVYVGGPLNVLVECTIPKGSKYYEGYFKDWGYGAAFESYASKELIVGDIVYVQEEINIE